MASRGNNNGGSGNGGLLPFQSIPSGSRKMVQSLREIVNCPEQEIYAMLKECNMDPNEAVNRLLSQDPFHEVKSKRDKKKEGKDTTESRSRGASGTSTRVNRGGTGSLHVKTAYRKENGTNSLASSSSSASGVAGWNTSHRPPPLSDSATTVNKGSTKGIVDGISSVSQDTTGYQPAWFGAPGQISMADIVKMGRPNIKSSIIPNSPHIANNQHVLELSAASFPDLYSSNDHGSKVSELNPELEVASAKHLSPNDGWLQVERPQAANFHPILEPVGDSELLSDPANLPFESINQHLQSNIAEVQVDEDSADESISANHVASTSVSSRKQQEDNFEVEDCDISVSSVTTNLEQLSIQKEGQGAPPDNDGPSVVIPDHLQIKTADCSHLSFGSFGSGISATFSGTFASRPLNTNLEETAIDADSSEVGHSDIRNSDYYGGKDSLRNVPDVNLAHRINVSHGDYDSASASQPEILKQENAEMVHGNQYAFSTSTASYSFENGQQLSTAISQSETNSQMQNLAPFSSVMAYTNSLSGASLAANPLPQRENELTYSPFPLTQSMPSKYGNTVSSISTTTISMPEALNNVGFSSNLPSQQTLPAASIATGPALPQHLAVHPYSQPNLPLGPFTNMIGYPLLPQGYTYLPSAFQQAFAGNNSYHQSLAAVLPQYKNSVSVSSLPQSGTVASGYGAFGSSTTIPGNFSVPGGGGGTTIGYDDILSSQYKDNSHLTSLQQNENSAMWLHGPASRTLSAVPSSAYYGYQAQNQQPSVFRQAAQNYGSLGYPNVYHSQTGISLEQQQQNLRDGSLSSAQGQPKPSQQVWQNGY